MRQTTAATRRTALAASPFALVAALFTLACLAELAAIVALCGRLFYSLDDPYIHLALAEGIARGAYGINPGELSAPSSSIIWPLLLVPFALLPWAEYLPLAINFAAALATLAVYVRVAELALAPVADTRRPLATALLAGALALATNVVGLVFTGMEHSLQVFLAALLVYGLVLEGRDGTLRWWVPAAIALGPLVRYESLALSAAALLYLLQRRHVRAALAAALPLALGLAAFSLFLRSAGLGLMPTSVELKSVVVGDEQPLIGLLRGVVTTLRTPEGWVILTPLALLVLALARPRGDTLLARCLLLAGIAHMLAGRYGWFARYEAYILAALLTGLASIYGARLARLFARPWRAAALLGVALLPLFPFQLFATASTPLAAANVYEQQYQMHRFAVEFYRGPLAANDIGWLTFRNDSYVLDLFGLASRQALLARMREADGAWMDTLAREHDVELAMLYAAWFPERPASWRPVAHLRLGLPRVMAAEDTVTFYAISPQAEPAIRDALERFAPTLPPGVALTFE